VVARRGDLEADGFGRIEQPLDVAFELEDPALVGADPFEHAVAVEQAVIEHAHARRACRSESAACVDYRVLRVILLSRRRHRTGSFPVEWSEYVESAAAATEPIGHWTVSCAQGGRRGGAAHASVLPAPGRPDRSRHRAAGARRRLPAAAGARSGARAS